MNSSTTLSAVGGRVARRGTPSSSIELTLPAMLALICGSLDSVSVNIVGQLFLSEIFILPAAVFLIASGRLRGRGRSSLFWGFMVAGWLTLLGYVLSDLYVGTAPSQYLRGWGRVFFLLSDCAAVMVFALEDRRNLWWLLLGKGLGGIAYSLYLGVPLEVWKTIYGYARSVTPALLALMAFIPRRLWLVILLGYGIFNIFLDYRSMGAAIIGVAVLGWATRRPPNRRFIVFAAGAVVAAAAIIGPLLATRSTDITHRLNSDIGRFAALEISLHAIWDSPFIGYGSWTRNEHLANEYRNRVEQERLNSGADIGFVPLRAGSGFQSHSQILQSWVEGGLLGAAFFIFFGIRLVRAIAWYALHKLGDRLTPLFLYTLIAQLWALFMSPFLGYERMSIAFAVGIVLAVDRERRSACGRSRANS